MIKDFIKIIILSLFISNHGYSQQDTKFTIKGILSNKINGIIYFSYFNVNREFVVDSLKITDSVFNFMGNISGPTRAKINIIAKGTQTLFSEDYKRLFIEPKNMILRINLNSSEGITLIGSHTQHQYIEHLKRNQPLLNEIKVAEERLPKVNAAKKNHYFNLIDTYNLRIISNDKVFIKSNPDSHVSSYLLYSLLGLVPMEEVKQLFKLLNIPKSDFFVGQISHVLGTVK